MFIGKQENLIDAKNRVIVPSKYRKELGEKCILTKGLDECLTIYPIETWKDQQARLAALPRTDKNARALRRFIYANAVDCELDKQGRIVIPQELREAAHITKDVIIIGNMDSIEMWDKGTYMNSEDGGKLSAEDFEKFSESYQV